MTLFDPDSLRPLVRRSDPDTSHAAAFAVGGGARRVEGLILALFRNGDGYTDDELCDLLPELHPPTVKTARSRLSKERPPILIDTGLRRPSHRGRDMIVWCEPGSWYSPRN